MKIGKLTAAQAYDEIRGLAFHDQKNEFGVKVSAPLLLVTPEILHALGIVENMESATFVVERDGKPMKIELKPFVRPSPEGHWAGTTSSRRVGLTRAMLRKHPFRLWLKDLENLFWFEYLADSKTVYVQFNGVADKENETVAAFSKRLFDFVEKNAVERLILDLRWNGGGNNYLNKPLIVGLIKSKVDERGKLFTIISRHTFSAAQNLVNELEKYTNTIFVGEPTGENVNFYGDSTRIVLTQ